MIEQSSERAAAFKAVVQKLRLETAVDDFNVSGKAFIGMNGMVIDEKILAAADVVAFVADDMHGIAVSDIGKL